MHKATTSVDVDCICSESSVPSALQGQWQQCCTCGDDHVKETDSYPRGLAGGPL